MRYSEKVRRFERRLAQLRGEVLALEQALSEMRVTEQVAKEVFTEHVAREVMS